MRVLQCGGSLINRNLVAADFLGERSPLGLAGEHVDGGMSLSSDERYRKRHRQAECEFHWCCLH